MGMPAALDQSSSIVERALRLRERMQLSLEASGFGTSEADSLGSRDETRLDWSKIDTSNGEEGHNCTVVARGGRQR